MTTRLPQLSNAVEIAQLKGAVNPIELRRNPNCEKFLAHLFSRYARIPLEMRQHLDEYFPRETPDQRRFERKFQKTESAFKLFMRKYAKCGTDGKIKFRNERRSFNCSNWEEFGGTEPAFILVPIEASLEFYEYLLTKIEEVIIALQIEF